MKVIILKSKPGTRFHFGKALGAFTEESHNTQKITSDYLHSDTLWSALLVRALSSPETVDDFIAQSISGAFKISSAFFVILMLYRKIIMVMSTFTQTGNPEPIQIL